VFPIILGWLYNNQGRLIRVLVTCRGKHAVSRGWPGKGLAFTAGPVLAVAAATGLYLASPAAASAAQSPAAVPATTPAAGTALAWGDNTYGELGKGTTGGISSTPVTVDLPAGTSVTAVSAGNDFSLALTSAGSVLAWGDNEYGQLGDHTTTNSSTPVPVDLPAGVRVTAVSAGGDFGLALTSTGTVLAWGYDGWGELGNGTTGGGDQFRSTPIPVDLPADVRVTAVSAGGDGGLALISGGGVLAWGANDYGQLGNGSTANDSPPVAVDLPPGVSVTAVAAGTYFNMALTSTGRIYAWGDNNNGELGDGGTVGTGGFSLTPVPVHLPAGPRVTAISAGGDFGLALVSGTGVLAWGNNDFGQMGNGTRTGGSPVPVPVDLPAGSRMTAVSAGEDYNLALTSTGGVVAWGDNGNGQLGDAGTANSLVPVAVDLPAGTHATAVAASGGPDGLVGGPAGENSLALTVQTSC
jgi:alpha-tubulin suppressor-like RCC1 family protein